ncbi:MAG: hypothetical protein E7271_02095 [Lachnospiraceae bacterium]|nr:hypothetical protein [Lachnospiraceae bacterium]
MNRKKHDRWYISDADESQEKWLVGDISDKPQESWGVPLWHIAQLMEETILIIRTKDAEPREKWFAANRLRELLQECSWDLNLSDLTDIYRDKKADNIIGYDTVAISTFVGQLLAEYPKP